jgi:hypothetical protein
MMNRDMIFTRPGGILATDLARINPDFYTWTTAGVGNIWGIPKDTQYADDHWGLGPLSWAERWDQMVGYVHGYDQCLTSGLYGIQDFRGYDPGSIMFLGAQMRQANDYEYEVTFEFSLARNKWHNLPATIDGLYANWIPGDLPESGDIRESPWEGCDQEYEFQLWVHGHDYLQFYYDNVDEDPGDGEGERVLPKPRHYRILQVDQYAPFYFLGLPSGAMTGGWLPCQSTVEFEPGWEASYCVPTGDDQGAGGVYDFNKAMLVSSE